MTARKTMAAQKTLAHADIVEHARSYGHEAIDNLAEQMREGSTPATKELLERGFGKAGQPVEEAAPNGGPVDAHVDVSPEVAAMLKAVTGIAE